MASESVQPAVIVGVQLSVVAVFLATLGIELLVGVGVVLVVVGSGLVALGLLSTD